MAMAWPKSLLNPPKNVENNKEAPDGFRIVKKTLSIPFNFSCGAPGVAGKSDDSVVPVTNASLSASTAIPAPNSNFEPPRAVE